MNIIRTVIDSPLGLLTLSAARIDGEVALVGLAFGAAPVRSDDSAPAYSCDPGQSLADPIAGTNPDRELADLLVLVQVQLGEYFAGARRGFDLPLHPVGTAFQVSVWNELLCIPFGETRSYADVAQAIGSPQGVRAVGAANGRNPIAIIIPCHRVINSAGQLHGYGGGLERKAKLLELEGAMPALFA